MFNKADFYIIMIKKKLILQWVVSIHRSLVYEANAITTSLHCKTDNNDVRMIVSKNSYQKKLLKFHNLQMSL